MLNRFTAERDHEPNPGNPSSHSPVVTLSAHSTAADTQTSTSQSAVQNALANDQTITNEPATYLSVLGGGGLGERYLAEHFPDRAYSGGVLSYNPNMDNQVNHYLDPGSMPVSYDAQSAIHPQGVVTDGIWN